jgi:hypothetical protein
MATPVPSDYPVLRNARMYAAQRIQSRAGMSKITASAFDQLSVHSIKRLNDKTVPTFDRIVGAGTKLYLASNPTAIDAGYSGNPLAMIPLRPDQSPQPWMYVGDANRMRKVLVDGTNYAMGIAPPVSPPDAELAIPAVTPIDDFEVVGSWTPGGTAGALSVITRTTFTLAFASFQEKLLVYDNGTGPGWASMVVLYPGIPPQETMRPGQRVTVSNGTLNEIAQIQEIIPPALSAPATIASIQYDSGTTGPCTVTLQVPQTQVRANQGYSPQMEEPEPSSFASRAQTTNPLGLRRNAMLVFYGAGAESVRVLYVSSSTNNSVSFRCSTTLPWTAGRNVIAPVSVRLYLKNVYPNAGNFNPDPSVTVTDDALQSTVGAGTGTISEVTPLDLSYVAGQDLPIQEDDIVHISFQIDDMSKLVEFRLIFDVDSQTNDFQHSYYFKSWAASDIQQALLGETTIQQARSASYSGIVVNQNIGNVSPLTKRAGPALILRRGDPSNSLFTRGANYPSSSKADPAGLGAWSELTCRVSDLTKVGSDATTSLAQVEGVRIQITVSSSAVCAVDSAWIGGCYGPDVGTTGAPYLYRFRYRSSKTGAVSLASPSIRTGLQPHRQSVEVDMLSSSDPQVDLMDVFRWGGTLPQWTYVGSCQNSAGVYIDALDDTTIANAPLLDTDKFQPFPTVDLPRSGTCNVVGTTVVWASGDQFNPRWYPGTEIVINGLVYNLYAQPPSATQLEIVQNGGTQTGVPFQIAQATLLAQPMPAFWGPYAQGTGLICFACGDPYQPGVLFLTNPNDPDSASDVLQIETTTPSEPLVNGCMFNGNSYVWSSENFFSLYPSFGQGYVIESGTLLPAEGTNLFVPLKVPNGKGLFGRYNVAVGSAMFSRARDGIYRSDGGAPQSITAGQLALLFPHGDQPGVPITVGTFTIYPPDDTLPNAQKLSYSNSFLYWDYQDTQGNKTTLVWSEVTGVWSKDDYTPAVLTHYGEEGENVNSLLLGGSDGNIYQASGDNDGNGSAFAFEVRMPQLSELVGGFQQVRDGYVGLMNSASANLVLNVDGADTLVALADTTAYKRFYVVLPPLKGQLLAMGLLGVSPFLGVFQRDCEFRYKVWGDADYSKVNPLGSFTRAASPKVT